MVIYLFVILVFHSAFHSWSGYVRLGVSYKSRYGIFGGEGNVFVHRWARVFKMGVRINEKLLSSLNLASGVE